MPNKGEKMERGIFDASIRTLHNGLKLITIKKDTQLTAIHTAVNIGSLYEKDDEKGIAHFIEHMLFKGTESRNNEELNNELEQRGGEYNAYTDYTSTVYSITALSDELEASLEILADMLQNAVFMEDELEKERGVILAEIRTSKDDVEDLSFARINEIAFKKSPLRFDTIGKEKTVKNFTRQQLVNFYKKYYVPNNSYISIVSPFEHDEMEQIINRYFGDWVSKEVEKEKVIIEDNHPCKKTTHKKDIEQSTIVYAFTFHNLNREEELALKILNHKFGESANSILFRKLREEEGLAYDVYTHLDMTSCVKMLYIYTAVSKESVNAAVELINDCITKIKTKEIKFDDTTVAIMKKVIKTAVASTLEDSTDLGNYVLHQTIDGESIYEFVDDMRDMESIKSEDIYSVARKVLDNPTIHILLSQNE